MILVDESPIGTMYALEKMNRGMFRRAISVFRKAFLNTLEYREMLQDEDKIDRTLVLLNPQKRAIGSSLYGYPNHSQRYVSIRLIAVLPSCQKNGAGTRLLTKTEESIAQRGFPGTYVIADSENKRWYEHRGYTVNSISSDGRFFSLKKDLKELLVS